MYCSSCGGKVEYLLKAPTFCSHCGVNMGGGGEKSIPRRAQSNASMQADDDPDDPDGTDVNHVPSLNGLQYEIDGDFGGIGRNHGTLGSLFNSPAAMQGDPDIEPNVPSSSLPPVKDTPKPSAQPKIKAVEQSIKDCQSSANKPVDVG